MITINSTSQYTTYSEIYDVPVSEMIIKPNEEKYVLLKIITNGTEIITYNAIENKTILGSFFVIISSKNDFLSIFEEKLKYELVLSDSVKESYILTPTNIVMKSRVNTIIPYFGIFVLVIYASVIAFLLKYVFPKVYLSNITLFVFLTLIISSAIFYVM